MALYFLRHNEKDVKVGIVAANNHCGGYGPGTVDIFRENMDMEKLEFENVFQQSLSFTESVKPNTKNHVKNGNSQTSVDESVILSFGVITM